MIAAFLLPFPFRGYRAPYLWVFYRLLSELNESALFILDPDYLASPDTWRAQNRWEMAEHAQQRLGYRLPSPDTLAQHTHRFLDETVFPALLDASGGNPLAAFRRLLTERIPLLEAHLAYCLDTGQSGGNDGIEAILTWCNCPSLSAVAAAREIPVVHLEMGPLRRPDYLHPTAYFDFSGVNGGTEAAARYARSPLRRVDATLAQMREFFTATAVQPTTESVARASTGVVLQVEDDSNLIAFGDGYDNQSLIVAAHLRDPVGSVLVRPHPGSLFALKDNGYRVDDSPNSVAFIRRCERILTINSSVGLEALLLDVPVTVLGDCSYRFILDAEDAGERLARLAYYLFAYLIPMQSIFDMDYLRFRLSRPTDAEIVIRHLDAYLGGEDWRRGLDGTVETSIQRALDFCLSPAHTLPAP